MFVNAISMAAEFTRPVVVSSRTREGNVATNCGSFILVNAEGWILTAAHVFQAYQVYTAHREAITNYEQQRRGIEENAALPPAKKRKLISRLECSRDWLINISFWWGQDAVTFKEFVANPLADIAVARLEGLTLTSEQKFPRFGDPKIDLPQGRSLCRLGFPFHSIKAEFNEDNSTFVFAPGALPIPRFPLDGILTRNVNVVHESDSVTARFIEMSTPGLRGQSGGPVFDVNGVVWAVQSQTRHLELGFQPTTEHHGKRVQENQFLNVGLASHVSEIVKLFETAGVTYNKAD